MAKKFDARITSKRKLTAEEFAEATKEHYSPEKQQTRLDEALAIVVQIIQSRKDTGFTYTEIRNLHQMVSLDEEYFDKFIAEIEALGTTVETNIDIEKKKDEVKISWN